MLNRAGDSHFHKAVLRKLYPPQPQHHPPDSQNEVKLEEIIKATEIARSELSEDQNDSHDSDSPSGSGQHLTRAQRKRLRKRKLKEAASGSKKFIGPLLPDDHVQENCNTEIPKCAAAECSGLQSQAETNMSDAVTKSADPSEGIGSSICHGKLKQRRLAKKLNQESARSTEREQLSKVFMAESRGAGYVLKHL